MFYLSIGVIVYLLIGVGAFIATGPVGAPTVEKLFALEHRIGPRWLFSFALAVATIPWLTLQAIHYAFAPTPLPQPPPLPPLLLPDPQRFEGTWIVAPQGRGKTTLLSAFLAEDLKTDASIIVMDSKGDLIDHLKQLAIFRENDRLVLIEPDASLALNPLSLGASSGHTIALLEYVFAGLLDAKTTALQSSLLRSVLMLCKAVPNANFTTLRQILQKGWRPFEQHLHSLHAEDREFFTEGEFDGQTYKKTREELLWRIRDLTTRVPLLRDMFSAPETKIDLSREMDAGKVIVIDNSMKKLGEGGSEFFARFFIALILASAHQRAGRPDSAKLPCYVYIDECQTVISNDNKIANILHQCRSQKIGLVLAHQEFQQIKSEDVRGALANCGVRIANVDDESKELGPRIRVDPLSFSQLRRGQFYMFARDLGTSRIEAPYDPIWMWPKMTQEEFEEIRRKMRERYSFTYEQPVVLVEDDPPSTPQPKRM